MGGTQSAADAISKVHGYLETATATDRKPAERAAAITRIETLCHSRSKAQICQSALSEPHHINQMLVLVLSREAEVSCASFRLVRTVSSTRSVAVKETLGRRLMEDLMELLSNWQDLHARPLEDLLATLANLLSVDVCRQELERVSRRQTDEQGGVRELVMLLDHPDACVQLQSLKALTAFSERASCRAVIVKEPFLSLIGLCFVETLYGELQYNALRLVASLSKTAELRRVIGPRGVIGRLTQAVVSDACDPLLSQLVASIYCNFSLHHCVDDIEPSKTMLMLYSLLCSNRLDDCVQGIWAIANALKGQAMRREFIETEGLKLIFSVLKHVEGEAQVWYEAGRVVATIASGGSADPPRCGGSDEEHEYLVREGSIEAIVAIFKWCGASATATPGMEAAAAAAAGDGPGEEDDVAPLHVSKALYNDKGEDIASSMRYMCLQVCARALRYLTQQGYVCQLLCDLGGANPLVTLLKADFDTEGQEHAACVIANLALHYDTCKTIVVGCEVVPALVDLVLFSSHELIHKEAACALANIGSMSGQYLREIVQAGGARALVGVLKNPGCTEETATHCVRALGMLDTNEAKLDVLEAGGLVEVMKFSYTESHELNLACAVTLRTLSELQTDVQQLQMVEVGVLETLLVLLAGDSNEVAREAALAIAFLTRLETNKLILLEHQGLEVLVGHLATTDKELLSSVLGVIGNLSSVDGIVDRLPHVEVTTRQICYVLQLNSFAFTLQAMRCLVELTRYPVCTTTVLAAMPAAVFVDMTLSHNVTLQRHATGVVANLAKDEEAWRVLSEAQIAHVLPTLFVSENFEVILAAVQCMGHLVMDPVCRDEVLSENNLVEHLVEIAKKAANIALGRGEASVDGFVASRNLSMLETVLGALRCFCTTEKGTEAVVGLYECLPIFISCLDCSSVHVRREAAGCVEVVVSHDEYIGDVQQQKGVEKAVQALRTSAVLLAEQEEEARQISRRLELIARTEGGFEARESLMLKLNKAVQLVRHNVALQTSCLRILYRITDSWWKNDELHTLQSMMILYDWPTFLAPMDSSDSHIQTAAGKLALTLLKANVQSDEFIRYGGVGRLLTFLEFKDEELKSLAAEGIQQLSSVHPAEFRQAIVEEGGIKRVMELSQSSVAAVRAQAYAGIAELSSHALLATELMSEGVLHHLRQHHNKCKYRPAAQVQILTIVGNLANHEALWSAVLDKGGTFLLFQAISHFELSVVAEGAAQLVKLVRSGLPVANSFIRCKLAPSIVACINKAFNPGVLESLLTIFLCMLEEASFREKIAKPELVEALLLLTTGKERREELAARAEAWAEVRKEVMADALAQAAPTDEADDSLTAKAPASLFENVATCALECLAQLLGVPGLAEHLAGTPLAVTRLAQAAETTSCVRRVVAAATIVHSTLDSPLAHATFLESSGLQRLAEWARIDEEASQLAVVSSFNLLLRRDQGQGNPNKVLEQMQAEKVYRGLKHLLSSHSNLVAMEVCYTVKKVLSGSDVFAQYNLVEDLIPYLGSDSELLQLQALDILLLLCPVYTAWFASGVREQAQAARNHCTPVLAKTMDVHRRTNARSKANGLAMHVFNTLLEMCPKHMCQLVDPAVMLDLRRAVLQASKGPGTPEMVYEKCNIDVKAYVQSKGKIPGIEAVDVKIQAARSLCVMTSVEDEAGTAANLTVQVMKVLGIDDMVAAAWSAFSSGYDARYVMLMMRLVDNACVRPAHCSVLAEDRSSLAKQIFAMTTHASPLVVQPAMHVICRIAEEPFALQKILTLAQVDSLARTALSTISSLLSVDAYSSGRGQSLKTGLSLTVAHVVTDICKLISHVSDGAAASAAVGRSLKEATDTLEKVLVAMPRQMPAEARVYVNAALCSLDAAPPAAHGVSLPCAGFVQAALNRSDNSAVAEGAQALYTLAADPKTHNELVEAGAIPALCLVLRNPTPAIFKSACWALIHLALGPRETSLDPLRDKTAKERTRAAEKRAAYLRGVAAQIVEAGVGPALKEATSHSKTDRVRAASKLVAVLLRAPATRRVFEAEAGGALLPPVSHEM